MEANGALLRPLPFADPEQLVAVFTVSRQSARLIVIPGIVHCNGVSCLRQFRAIALRLPEPMATGKGMTPAFFPGPTWSRFSRHH